MELEARPVAVRQTVAGEDGRHVDPGPECVSRDTSDDSDICDETTDSCGLQTAAGGMGSPVYPSLGLPAVDQHWFNADAAVDEESELAQLEKEHHDLVQDIANRDVDLLPTAQEDFTDDGVDEEEESGPEDDEEESDTNEEEDDEEVEEIDVH